MIAESEVWQVYTQGQVFETDIETLKQWVSEGAVARTDKVKKGSLTWIEAGRAPALRRVFTGEERVEPQQAAAAHVAPPLDAAQTQTSYAPQQAYAQQGYQQPAYAPQVHTHEPGFAQQTGFDHQTNTGGGSEGWLQAVPEPGLAQAQGGCHFHPEAQPKYVCRVCRASFCRECPNFVGSNKVPLCKVCGDLCKPVEEVRARYEHRQFQSSGFGLADFMRAVRYPFQNKVSLISGAVLYGFLLLSGFKGRLLASAIMFGCISLVINKVAYGKLDKNFLPDFSEFSLWDDLIVPIFLGLGVTAVTLGPTLLLVVALFMGWFPTGDSQPVLANPVVQEQKAEDVFSSEDMQAIIDSGDPEKEAEAMKKLEQLHPGTQITTRAREAEESMAGLTILKQLMASPGLIILLLLVSLGWALFYYPMALAVAGYTEDFWSTVNPLVGLNTIRLMGIVYAKAFLMYLAVQVVGFGVSFVIALVTAPFEMPFVGNLPGMFLDGMITFYTSLVVACILGLAIFKSADRLGIDVD